MLLPELTYPSVPATFAPRPNRTRTFVVTVLRLLAERGIAGALPDLPGQGESLVPTQAMRLADMRAAFATKLFTLSSLLRAYQSPSRRCACATIGVSRSALDMAQRRAGTIAARVAARIARRIGEGRPGVRIGVQKLSPRSGRGQLVPRGCKGNQCGDNRLHRFRRGTPYASMRIRRAGPWRKSVLPPA